MKQHLLRAPDPKLQPELVRVRAVAREELLGPACLLVLRLILEERKPPHVVDVKDHDVELAPASKLNRRTKRFSGFLRIVEWNENSFEPTRMCKVGRYDHDRFVESGRDSERDTSSRTRAGVGTPGAQHERRNVRTSTRLDQRRDSRTCLGPEPQLGSRGQRPRSIVAILEHVEDIDSGAKRPCDRARGRKDRARRRACIHSCNDSRHDVSSIKGSAVPFAVAVTTADPMTT